MHPSDEPTDDALVTATCAGDEAAFEQLFERHRRRVARIASRFFARPEQIEEIIQESFTKAYLALHGFAGAHAASFSAWLAQITVNACYDELRRTQRRPEQQLTELSDAEAHTLSMQLQRTTNASASDVESALVARDLAGKLLARLAPDDRLVLTLLDAEGLSVAEIAQLTGWSGAKVKVRAHRARAHLRRILRKYL
ncbi:MAG TPA: sigma-70 family RNA polymerase sigma factor [Pyrinomonadaceae bacterium]|nr:sigma-70 family RNA polymerase sigma factor [Pyrinomonadaceae bacterium]